MSSAALLVEMPRSDEKHTLFLAQNGNAMQSSGEKEMHTYEAVVAMEDNSGFDVDEDFQVIVLSDDDDDQEFAVFEAPLVAAVSDNNAVNPHMEAKQSLLPVNKRKSTLNRTLSEVNVETERNTLFPSENEVLHKIAVPASSSSSTTSSSTSGNSEESTKPSSSSPKSVGKMGRPKTAAETEHVMASPMLRPVSSVSSSSSSSSPVKVPMAREPGQSVAVCVTPTAQTKRPKLVATVLNSPSSPAPPQQQQPPSSSSSVASSLRAPNTAQRRVHDQHLLVSSPSRDDHRDMERRMSRTLPTYSSATKKLPAPSNDVLAQTFSSGSLPQLEAKNSNGKKKKKKKRAPSEGNSSPSPLLGKSLAPLSKSPSMPVPVEEDKLHTLLSSSPSQSALQPLSASQANAVQDAKTPANPSLSSSPPPAATKSTANPEPAARATKRVVKPVVGQRRIQPNVTNTTKTKKSKAKPALRIVRANDVVIQNKTGKISVGEARKKRRLILSVRATEPVKRVMVRCGKCTAVLGVVPTGEETAVQCPKCSQRFRIATKSQQP